MILIPCEDGVYWLLTTIQLSGYREFKMSHNILYRNDATASPKRLQTTQVQIPDEDRIVKKTFCCKLIENPEFWV